MKLRSPETRRRGPAGPDLDDGGHVPAFEVQSDPEPTPWIATEHRPYGAPPPAAPAPTGPRPPVQLKVAERRARAADEIRRLAQEGTSGGGGPLPHADTVQRAFGPHDVSSVEAHVGGRGGQAAKAMGAAAFATGDAVAFAGTPDLHTAAHEAAHVVQQRAGVDVPGGVGQVGDAHERHADAVADRVVQGRSAVDLLGPVTGTHAPSLAVQHYIEGATLEIAAFQKISTNGKIVIKGAQECYATADMIEAANAGALAIQFKSGATLDKPDAFTQRFPDVGDLKRIVPEWRADAAKVPSPDMKDAQERSPKAGDTAGQIANKHKEFEKFINTLLADIKEFTKQATVITREALGRTAIGADTLVPVTAKAKLGDLSTQMIRGPRGAILGPMVGVELGGYDNMISRIGVDLKLTDFYTWLSWFTSHFTKEAEKELATPAENLVMPNDCGAASAAVAGKSPHVAGQVSDDPGIGQTFKMAFGGDQPEESWAVHYATVVMVDGTDKLSMETGVQPGRMAAGKSYWTYNLYGTAEGQSFVEQTTAANQAHIAKTQAHQAKAVPVEKYTPPRAD